MKTCCMACLCPCIAFGRISEILDKGSTSCGASGARYILIMYHRVSRLIFVLLPIQTAKAE
ncbi:hypothetical protein Golob_021767 [Gossypium lobatum]|uniref:Uncharacterized protein n=1 Tax=Gossypium lobatum TaxID=34289 RepID=A0A7J8LEJ0_9ROSI|nr:hypothetical protein [Gossypium lobatum]